MEIQGSTILVTGASSGIGRAVAVDLAGRGAKVVAVARGEEALEELAQEVSGIQPMVGDITDAGDRRRILADAGTLDALINNAGTAWVGAFVDMDEDEISDMVGLNVVALMALCRAAIPAMLERDAGHVINLGSTLGFAPGPPLSVYSATKAAVHAFTEGLRREVVGTNVRVSLVVPGPVKGTAGLDNSSGSEATATIRKAFETFGTTTDQVASAVRYALEHDARPSARTITVPRLAGLSRFASVPGADWAMDHGFQLLRKAGVKLS